MELAAAGIGEQPFRTHGTPLTFVSYRAQRQASAFLQATYHKPHGLGLLQGPSLSGKTTIIRHFLASLDRDTACALVDGRHLDARGLLQAALRRFGFDIELDSLNELASMLRVFVLQQAAAHDAPILIVENVQALQSDALSVLHELAALRVRSDSALRLVLASDRSIGALLRAPVMDAAARRLTGSFNLAPLGEDETRAYLHTKLRAGGCDRPQRVFPDDVCEALHDASGGWPGIVDRLALLGLAKAKRAPLTPAEVERPLVPRMTGEAGLQRVGEHEICDARLFLTCQGRTLREIPLNRPRLMIGRSAHNDIPIPSRFISRHHALFIRDGDTTLLMDLNSTNGTFVNSRRVSNHIMANNDIVNLGHHGLKFVDPNARERRSLDGADFSETVIMKSIGDMHRLLARENTQIIALSDDEASG